MALTFNTSGPCVPDEHYMLSPAKRFERIIELIDQKKYITVVAGRQTGKTTALQWLVKRLNQADKYAAVWVDLQTAREQPKLSIAFTTVLNEFDMALERDLPDIERPAHSEIMKDPSTAILKYLQNISRQASRPLVVFVDEADGLVGEAMVSFLVSV